MLLCLTLQTRHAEQLTYCVPVVEPKDTVGAFLCEDPRHILARGDIANVPIMAGCTTHESLMTLGSKFIKNLNLRILINELCSF
jgi:hypothetical protein